MAVISAPTEAHARLVLASMPKLALEQLLIGAATVLAVYGAQLFKLAGREESIWWFPAGLGLAMRFDFRVIPALFLGSVLCYAIWLRYPVALALWTSPT